jgi:hypothetical protein
MAHPSFSNKGLEAREGALNICKFTFKLIVASFCHWFMEHIN